MRTSAGRFAIATCALSMSVIGITNMPIRAYSQGSSGDYRGSVSGAANKKIDLDLESTNLYYGLKLLFSQVKANFTIDESLKSLTVTAHLTQVPFRVALETLLKSTSTPLTYKVEDGIYSIVPKVEESPPVAEEKGSKENETAPGGYKFGIIHPNNMSAVDIVQAFGGHVVNVGYDPTAYGNGGMGGMMGGMGMGMGGMGGMMGGMGGMGMGGMGMGGMGMGGMGMGGIGMGGMGKGGMGMGGMGMGGIGGGRGF